MLEIGRTQRGVGVGGVAEQGAQVVLRTGPLVEATGDRRGDACLLAVAILGEMERVDGRVHEIAEQISDGRGADQGKEQIGAGPYPIAPQGVAEGARMMWQARLAGDVDHAAQARG